ncbi:MAG: 50S ribosomal protein L29 [Flavobacteriales bacterium]|jgi:large subunit ribosomal protein L29|uniref:50S ribosomal protein L29 n=1 Tax=Blattabacterium sp. (Mastotermes darwiniensis) TaxID=39768 RepID=UPI000231DE6B|nr:50S ribosomal protein L29 [Blattabacterium sp. (Mastotermes darwiniensis)]AER40671.1 50S ribosomal protein L29 [Blattabacterium sp. (Mastotermes darwiniensis) str. MADAR]MDR1804801.1 50S ribosomal protein L29 [Flavobacteriales bacterium]
MKKYSKIKIFSVEDIEPHINIQKENYRRMKFDHAFGLKKNPVEIRFLRKYIAKLKTELNKLKSNK